MRYSYNYIIDEAIAKYFHARNVLFSHVEYFYFKKMVNVMTPGYEPPNRNSLAGKNLDDMVKKGENELRKMLKDMPVTIQGGCSDMHNKPVISNCLSDGMS